MVKTNPRKQVGESLTINGTSMTVRVGDNVILRSPDEVKDPYIAKVKKIVAEEYKVKVQWYWRPEDTIGGRRQFHGSKELFLSDKLVEQSAHTIEGKCFVHSFTEYTKLEIVGPDDYFCRFNYIEKTGAFRPDRVVVNCKCELPWNPDVLMVGCEECKEWFHPECVGMSVLEAKQMDKYVCTECADQVEAPSKRLKKDEKEEAP